MDYVFEYSREGVELLAAGVLKNAYNELIDARLADAAFMFHKVSYNCHCYREKLKNGRGPYGIGEDGKDRAKQDIRVLEKWFRSERCKVFCINATGDWFIDIARHKARQFALDEIPEWMAKPTFDTSSSTGGNSVQRRRDYQEWKKRRDKWREEHKLTEVKCGRTETV